jgi:sugar phosphate isomerase/epimerase
MDQIAALERIPEGALVRDRTCNLGTDLMTLSAAIRAKQRGLTAEQFVEEQIEQILLLKVDQLELHFDADLLFPGTAEIAVNLLKDCCRDMVYSLHLPFRYLDVSCPIERIRLASVGSILDAIELAADLSPNNYVIHLTGNVFTSYRSGLDPLVGEVMAHVEESLDRITRLVNPSQLLVENLPQVDFDYFMRAVKRLGLSVCMDIGHVVLQGGDYLEFARSYSSLIREIHLHDVIRSHPADSIQVVKDHQAIGTGMLDFEQFFTVLNDIGFRGSIILEVDDKELIPISIKRVRDLMDLHVSKFINK